MPQWQYNNPQSAVFIKLNYINVRTAGGGTPSLHQSSPPPSIAQLPDSLPIAIEPTNKTDKTSEIRKVARLLGGSVPDEISKVGKRLSLCLSGCLSV